MRFNSHPIFRWHSQPWFGFFAPGFEPELNNMLKSIPVGAWEHNEKTWWYPSEFFPVVEATAAPYFQHEMGSGRYLDFLRTKPAVQSDSPRVAKLELALRRIKVHSDAWGEQSEGLAFVIKNEIARVIDLTER